MGLEHDTYDIDFVRDENYSEGIRYAINVQHISKLGLYAYSGSRNYMNLYLFGGLLNFNDLYNVNNEEYGLNNDISLFSIASLGYFEKKNDDVLFMSSSEFKFVLNIAAVYLAIKFPKFIDSYEHNAYVYDEEQVISDMIEMKNYNMDVFGILPEDVAKFKIEEIDSEETIMELDVPYRKLQLCVIDAKSGDLHNKYYFVCLDDETEDEIVENFRNTMLNTYNESLETMCFISAAEITVKERKGVCCEKTI